MNENGQQQATMHVARIRSTIINDYNQSLNSHTFPVRVSRIMRVGKLDFRGENDHLEHLKHAGGTHIFFLKKRKRKRKKSYLLQYIFCTVAVLMLTVIWAAYFT